MPESLDYVNSYQRFAIEEAISAWVSDYRGALRGYLLSLGAKPSYVEDLTQDTMSKATEKLKEFLHPDLINSPKGFLFSIGRNLFFDDCRKKKRRGGSHFQLEDENVSDSMLFGEADPSSRCESFDLVARALEDLTPERLRILENRFVNGYTLSEIADREGIPESDENRAQKIWNRIDRAIKAVRKKCPMLEEANQRQIALDRTKDTPGK